MSGDRQPVKRGGGEEGPLEAWQSLAGLVWSDQALPPTIDGKGLFRNPWAAVNLLPGERGARLTWTLPEVLTAARLSDLCRLVVERAGIPISAGEATADRFVVRSGPEPPELLAKLLQEGLAEDAPEIPTLLADQEVDPGALAPGEVVVQQGYRAPGPIPLDLWQSVRGGRVLLFAVERRGPKGELVSVLWAALSDEPPDQEAPLKAVLAWEIIGHP
jgi:hypothetical protein